ncbi:MAG: radical SAM protein [Ruminococcaceae bacterium]|nr:radical SAM protein [Oscillospiraceae bacterium]
MVVAEQIFAHRKNMTHRCLPIFIPHMACNNNCVFCNQKRIAGTVAPPTVAEVKAMLKKGLCFAGGTTHIAFFGGSFTGIEKKQMIAYLKVAKQFVDMGDYCGIRVSTRPDYISEDILKILKRYNVTTIELGTQSLDNGVLAASKRGHTANDVYKAVELIRQYGFELVLQMMVGLPKDDEKKAMQTGRKIVKLAPDGVRIYPTVVIKDTELAEMYEKGEYTPLSLDEAVDISTKLLSLFEKNNIPVIRIGLHSDESLTDGDSIVAGPFHSSFGEMCHSRIYYKLICKSLKTKEYKDIIIRCALGEISKITGNRKANIKRLKAEMGIKKVKIIESPKLTPKKIRITSLVKQSKEGLF